MLKKIGTSLALIIPKVMTGRFNAGQKIKLIERDDGILLTRHRARTRRPIDELDKQMNPAAYARNNRKLLCDSPVGREVL